MSTIQSQIEDTVSQNKGKLQDLRANLMKSALNSLQWPENKSAKIVVLGLSGAGKSTFIEFLEKGSVDTKRRRPTLAFSFHQVNFGKLKAIFVDVPGQQSYWANWKSYMKGADGVIFVIDSTKLSEVQTANDIYHRTMKDLNDIPVVFLANKQDLQKSITGDAVARMMSLHGNPRKTKVFDTIAVSGNGLHSALLWLLDTSSKMLVN